MGPPSTANGRIRARKVGCDLSTSYASSVIFYFFSSHDAVTGDSGKLVLFLTLCNDVIEGRRTPISTAINNAHQWVLVVPRVQVHSPKQRAGGCSGVGVCQKINFAD